MTRRMTVVEALREALREEMQRDELTYCMGEDIDIPGGFGGAFTVTLGASPSSLKDTRVKDRSSPARSPVSTARRYRIALSLPDISNRTGPALAAPSSFTSSSTVNARRSWRRSVRTFKPSR